MTAADVTRASFPRLTAACSLWLRYITDGPELRPSPPSACGLQTSPTKSLCCWGVKQYLVSSGPGTACHMNFTDRTPHVMENMQAISSVAIRNWRHQRPSKHQTPGCDVAGFNRRGCVYTRAQQPDPPGIFAEGAACHHSSVG